LCVGGRCDGRYYVHISKAIITKTRHKCSFGRVSIKCSQFY
jgi:hypothetical protein